MKLIRALWGDKKEIKEEIPTKPDDSVVYVWGKDNLDFLKSLGYKTRFVEDTLESDYKFKLISLDLGFKEFEECIFLDWDCKQIKSIDNLEFNSPSGPSIITAALILFLGSLINYRKSNKISN